MATESPTKATETTGRANTTSDRVLCFYQPSGVEDRSVGSRVFLVDLLGKKRQLRINRGVQQLPRTAWEQIKATKFGQQLIETRQLILVANSLNIFEDNANRVGIFGQLRLEDLIDRTFDKTSGGLLEQWASYLKSQDLTKSAANARYLKQINDRLDSPSSPFDLPSPSNAPLDPRAANFADGLGQI